MNKSELIEFYEEELLSINNEREYHLINKEYKLVAFCKGERIRVMEFIEALKNLNGETVKSKEGCPICESLEHTKDGDMKICKVCNESYMAT